MPEQLPNVHITITAVDKVGTLSLMHEGKLVVIHDGAVVPAGAWERARKSDQLARHVERGRVIAKPTEAEVTPIPKKDPPESAPSEEPAAD